MIRKGQFLSASQCYLLLLHAAEQVYWRMYEAGCGMLNMVPVVVAGACLFVAVSLQLFVRHDHAPDEVA
jgi:hypothetical protein